jgi:hypothetical protein
LIERRELASKRGRRKEDLAIRPQCASSLLWLDDEYEWSFALVNVWCERLLGKPSIVIDEAVRALIHGNFVRYFAEPCGDQFEVVFESEE